MRCDWPAGFNEDCADPACEIYLQLFIENPDIADDVPDDVSPYNQLIPAFIIDAEQGEEYFMNFQGDEVSSDAQSSNGDFCMNIVSVTDISSESSDSYAETHGHFSGAVPHHEETSNSEYAVSGLSNSVSEVSVCDAENQELNGAELQCKETFSKLSDEESSNKLSDEESSNRLFDEESSSKLSEEETSSKLSEEETPTDIWHPDEIIPFPEYESDVSSELECMSIDSHSSECFHEATTNDIEESTDNCDTVPLSRELPNINELSQELESSNNISTSTHVSLLVVVPPTNFSNEISDNLLPAHSPDNLFAELLPLDISCSAELRESCKETVQSKDSQEISCKEGEDFSKSNTTCTAECANPDILLLPNLTGISSDCEVSSLLSECNVLYEMGFDDLGPKTSEPENSISPIENQACSEFTTDEYYQNKKRKVSSSSDDGVINKVPRYSSEASSDSVSVQEKENYCKALSCDSDKQISSDGDVSDILPAAASDDVILTLGKAVEDSSLTNEKPKSR